MTTTEPAGGKRLMNWLVVVLFVVLMVSGLWSTVGQWKSMHRFWADIVARAEGPMTFRFYLQPTMAAIAALHDGIRDARSGHRVFFWTAWLDPAQHPGRLRQGMISDGAYRTAGAEYGRDLSVPRPAQVLSRRSAHDRGSACRHSVFHFPVDCRGRRALVVCATSARLTGLTGRGKHGDGRDSN